MLGKDLADFVDGVLDAQSPLKAIDRLVLIALATYASSSGVCWPAVGTLANRTGADPTTVRKAIRRLERAGLLKVSGQRNGFQSRTYALSQRLLPSPSAGQSQDGEPADTGEVSPSVSVSPDAIEVGQDPPPKLPPPPAPGKRPAEFLHRIKDKNGTYVDLSSERGSKREGYSSGETPGESKQRVELDFEEFWEVWQSLVMRFSYFLADQLIARGPKKPGYRDDALSEDWLGFTEKLLSEQGCLYAVSIEEMETAIELFLDGEGGEHVRRPRDLCCLAFDQAVRRAQTARENVVA